MLEHALIPAGYQRLVQSGVALGLRAHSGWACVVVVRRDPASAEVAAIGRRRIVLADPGFAGSKQPYHAAEALDIDRARALVSRCIASSRRLAEDALDALVGELERAGDTVSRCGLLLAAGKPVGGELAVILASHARIHAAEGELFRSVLLRAAERRGLEVRGVRERDVYALGASELGLREPALRARLDRMREALGPPWTQDEKLAALAGWLALPPQRGR